ncbi:MAG TPA: hypothetical protein VMT24_04575 [Aggregatilineaceae bacterium]|nr:hypothetical protein [Aggregatilineaceae bacterium]
MDEQHNNEQRPRASVRGKGREILLGQRSGGEPPSDADKAETSSPSHPPQWLGRVDASALSLTPEETEALLDFSPSASALDAETPSPAGEDAPVGTTREPPLSAPGDAWPDWMVDAAGVSQGSAPPASSQDAAHDWVERVDLGSAAASLVGSGSGSFDTELSSPTLPEAPRRNVGALPLAERGRASVKRQQELLYQARPEVEALIPREPEWWPGEYPSAMPREGRAEDQDVEAETSAGSLAAPEVVVADEPAGSSLPDQLQPVLTRGAPRVPLEQASPASKRLLDLLVDDGHVRKLAEQIEALHEELAQQTYADRTAADAYQEELLQASSLLLASRQNYEGARAAVYRVRTDMNRQRKTYADIMRYRPLLLNYYVGWGIALVVLFLLKALFTGVTDAVGVGVVSALYYPMLLGVGGALVSGFLTLERHTTRLRDFDPIHISWYLFNPLLGGVMGLLMFLIASIANEDLLQETATRPEYAITYLLCVVAGMNQNNVLRQLNDLLKRFSRNTAK